MFSCKVVVMIALSFSNWLQTGATDVSSRGKLVVKGKVETRDASRCTVVGANDPSIDDAPTIIEAFEICGQGGKIVFTNTTYNINTVMTTTGLKDCVVELNGTLLWSTNTTYWLAHSMEVGYQNQSTVWYFGGDNITFNGFGFGTFNGNGQTWYDLVKGISNFPNRPMAFTPWFITNSVFNGIRFVQSQMWTMAIMHSRNVLFNDIFVSSTSNDSEPARNTDGVDTIYSDGITFNEWTVINGDDSISLKANSTNISITNCNLINGLGIAMGSIGQYKGVYEEIHSVTANNVTFNNTEHAVYFKTWTGDQVGFPPNGGGGGLGFAYNMTFNNLHGTSFTSEPFLISQCTTFSGVVGNCTDSDFGIHNISFANLTGTSKTSNIASFQCSAVQPCANITIEKVDVTASGGATAAGYLCSDLVTGTTTGFECTGNT